MGKSEILSAIALALVAVLVLAGLVRLFLSSWTYVTLVVAAVVAAYFVVSQMQREWKHG